MAYYGQRYWETETPEQVDSSRLRLNYYPKAGKLQVSSLYIDRKTQEIRPGRTVTLDREDLILHPAAAELLIRALNEWREDRSEEKEAPTV